MPPAASPRKPVRLARRLAYGHAWMRLYLDRVRFPGGRIVSRFHVLKYPRNSAAAIVEDDRGRILMVRAYRYVTGTIEWEIPVGMMERGETPAAAAAREAREEGGVQTRGHRLILAFYPFIGVSDIVFHVVRCRLARAEGDIDANEIHSRRWTAPETVRRMIRSGAIRDGYTLTALLFYFAHGGRAARRTRL